jgi:hypothetical protein
MLESERGDFCGIRPALKSDDQVRFGKMGFLKINNLIHIFSLEKSYSVFHPSVNPMENIVTVPARWSPRLG